MFRVQGKPEDGREDGALGPKPTTSSRPPAEPATLADIYLVNPWDTTYGSKPLPLLIHDSRALAGPNRILSLWRRRCAGPSGIVGYLIHGWQLQCR